MFFQVKNKLELTFHFRIHNENKSVNQIHGSHIHNYESQHVFIFADEYRHCTFSLNVQTTLYKAALLLNQNLNVYKTDNNKILTRLTSYKMSLFKIRGKNQVHIK